MYSTGLGIRSMVFRANRSFFVSKRATGGNRLWLRFCKERREQIAHVGEKYKFLEGIARFLRRKE